MPRIGLLTPGRCVGAKLIDAQLCGDRATRAWLRRRVEHRYRAWVWRGECRSTARSLLENDTAYLFREFGSGADPAAKYAGASFGYSPIRRARTSFGESGIAGSPITRRVLNRASSLRLDVRRAHDLAPDLGLGLDAGGEFLVPAP